MRNVVLFDQDTQPYLESIYRKLEHIFHKLGFHLIVVYDQKLNSIPGDELFLSSKYTFQDFKRIVESYNPEIIIQRTWLKYKFLIPFMIFVRCYKNIKIITWTKGINIYKPDKVLMNQFYYLRQYLSNALLLYDNENKKYIKVSKEKVFVAKNTLNFDDFPVIKLTKEKLKEIYGFKGKRIILMVGRLNLHNRKPEIFLKVRNELLKNNYIVLIVGSGLSEEIMEKFSMVKNIKYFGAIYDKIRINEFYKMSDIFCMPGRIGLALNHAFYYGLPVVLENIMQGVETSIFISGYNGLFFSENDAADMFNKIKNILSNDIILKRYGENARKILFEKASLDRMLQGFKDAVEYVTKRRQSLE